MNLFNRLSHRRPRVRGRVYIQSGKKERSDMLSVTSLLSQWLLDRAMNDEDFSSKNVAA